MVNTKFEGPKIGSVQLMDAPHVDGEILIGSSLGLWVSSLGSQGTLPQIRVPGDSGSPTRRGWILDDW